MVAGSKIYPATARVPKISPKFAPAGRLIPKSKSLKTGGAGALFEAKLRKICTTQPKSLKQGGLGTFFEVQTAFCLASEKNSRRCKMSGRCQSSYMPDLKRVGNDAFYVAGAMISCFEMLMFQASDAQSVERLPEVLLSRDHFVWLLQEFVCFG